MGFRDASKKRQKLRLGIQGASGSGKTFSALLIASGMVDDISKVGVIDTEDGSSELYTDTFGSFKILVLDPPYMPEAYIKAFQEAEQAGIEVLITDSISHEWMGVGGCLEIASKMGGNSYVAWGKVTPRHDRFIDAIRRSKMHMICTLRSKAQYETGKNDRGKMTIEKVGTSPQQREGVDFELTTVLNLNKSHYASSDKDRTGLFDGKDFLVTKETGKELIGWLDSGEVIEQPVQKSVIPEPMFGNKASSGNKQSVFNWNQAKDEIVEMVKKVHMSIDSDRLLYFRKLFKAKKYAEENYLEDKFYLEDLIQKVAEKEAEKKKEESLVEPNVEADGKEPDLGFNADIEEKGEELPNGVI